MSVNADKRNSTRLLLFSDTHGSSGPLRQVVHIESPCDGILHCGDGLADLVGIHEKYHVPVYRVAGNEDFMYAEVSDRHLLVADYCVMLMIHGHQWDLNPYYDKELMHQKYNAMAEVASHDGAGILIFGHTHEPAIVCIHGTWLVNPGSMYNDGRSAMNYMVMIAEKELITLYLKEFTGSACFTRDTVKIHCKKDRGSNHKKEIDQSVNCNVSGGKLQNGGTYEYFNQQE